MRELLPLRPADISCRDREDWLAQRVHAIGASETPTILGVGYAGLSLLSVWYRKTHPDDNEQQIDDGLLEKMNIGTLMEPVIRDVFRKKTGIEILPDLPHTIRVHPECNFVSATLDGLLEHDEHGLCVAELKNVGSHAAADWKGDAAPLKYEVQLQQQLAVTGCRQGVLVALIGGDTPVIRWRQRDDRFIEAMLSKLSRFWNYVVTEIEPPVDGSEATAKMLKQLHPDDNGHVIALPDEAAMWDLRRNEMQLIKKFAEKRIEWFDNQLKACLGDNTYGLLPDGSCFSWKTSETTGHTRTVKPGKRRTFKRSKKLPPDVIYQPALTTDDQPEVAGLLT